MLRQLMPAAERDRIGRLRPHRPRPLPGRRGCRHRCRRRRLCSRGPWRSGHRGWCRR
jgi:hypothetical protein